MLQTATQTYFGLSTFATAMIYLVARMGVKILTGIVDSGGR